MSLKNKESPRKGFCDAEKFCTQKHYMVMLVLHAKLLLVMVQKSFSVFPSPVPVL